MSTVHRYISRMRRKAWHRSYYKTLQDIPGRVHCQSIENRTALRFCHGLTSAKFEVLSVHRMRTGISVQKLRLVHKEPGCIFNLEECRKANASRNASRLDWERFGQRDASTVTRRGITLPDQLEQFAKFIWVCLKIGYTPNYSHLVGIMIINHH